MSSIKQLTRPTLEALHLVKVLPQLAPFRQLLAEMKRSEIDAMAANAGENVFRAQGAYRKITQIIDLIESAALEQPAPQPRPVIRGVGLQ